MAARPPRQDGFIHNIYYNLNSISCIHNLQTQSKFIITVAHQKKKQGKYRHKAEPENVCLYFIIINTTCAITVRCTTNTRSSLETPTTDFKCSRRFYWPCCKSPHSPHPSPPRGWGEREPKNFCTILHNHDVRMLYVTQTLMIL